MLIVAPVRRAYGPPRRPIRAARCWIGRIDHLTGCLCDSETRRPALYLVGAGMPRQACRRAPLDGHDVLVGPPVVLTGERHVLPGVGKHDVGGTHGGLAEQPSGLLCGDGARQRGNEG